MDILSLKMIQPNDAEVETVKDYLKKLLTELWNKGEGFSGKRPFGNSGWECELYHTLVINKAISGKYTTDQDGYVDVSECDEKAANRLIFEAIASL
jgi:hypothetical protein